jgi:predicted site-specific integrase-resolvase
MLETVSDMPLITTSRAAKILDTSEGTVRGMTRRGELPYTLTESGIRLFERDVVERIAGERQARREARDARGAAA